MGFDLFTLRGLAAQLHAEMAGRRIGRANDGPGGLALSCSRQRYVLATHGPRGYLAAMDGDIPADFDGFEGAIRYIQGARVEAVEAQRKDRIITMRLSRTDGDGQKTYGLLHFELIRPHCQQVLLSEHTGKVLGRWSAARKPGPRAIPGRAYMPPPQRRRVYPGEEEIEGFHSFMQEEEGPLAQRLGQVLAGIDKVVVPELLFRADLDPELPVSQLDAGANQRLWQVLLPLYQDTPSAVGYLWTSGGKTQYSALEPTHMQGQYKAFEAISQAIDEGEQAGAQSAAPKPDQPLRRRLARLGKRYRKKEQDLHRDLEEARRADELEKHGSILMAQLNLVQAGRSQVELADIFDATGQGRVRIELDPTKPPAVTAEGLLKRAQKYRRRLQVLPRRLAAVRDLGQQVARFVQQLDDSPGGDWQDMEEWLEQRERGGQGRGRAAQAGPQAHPRRYRTSSGWSVWAGRNNKENDILTHKMASQNDLWFHAHGYSGSHVVLRREGRREEPSGRTLEEAAAVAAYWSKGRTAKKVPVVYTLVKYVSKPRGGPPGLAVLKREKSIMVRPELLDEENKTHN